MAKWNEKSFYCLDGNVLLIEVMQHTLNPLSPEYKQKVAGFPFLFHVRPQKKCLFLLFCFIFSNQLHACMQYCVGCFFPSVNDVLII